MGLLRTLSGYLLKDQRIESCIDAKVEAVEDMCVPLAIIDDLRHPSFREAKGAAALPRAVTA